MSVPKAANLSSGRTNAVDVYRNRFVSPVTNGQGSVANPGATLNIYLNTAQVSTLMDPQSCYLQFDLKMWTRNPYVDFCSFGMEGVASIIKELRVLNQGNPLEEILKYGLAYRVFTFLSGSMQQEFKMFMGQSWPDGGLYRFPPPMCDWDGQIMHGPAIGAERPLGAAPNGNTNPTTNANWFRNGIHQWPEQYSPNPATVVKFREKMGNVRVQDFMMFFSACDVLAARQRVRSVHGNSFSNQN